MFTMKPVSRVPRQVVFTEESRVVVGGSDHGVVYVFGCKSGGMLQILRHAPKGLVQTVTAHEGPEANLILAASSDGSGPAIISVWRNEHTKKAPLTVPTAPTESTNANIGTFDMIVRLIVVICGCLWMYQKILETNIVSDWTKHIEVSSV